MIYLISFVLSIGLIGFPAKGKRTRSILIFLGLLIPCILAGARALSVGSDTGDYPLSLFLIAKSNGYFTYLNTTFMHMWVRDYVYEMGIGYATFVYLVTFLFKEYAAVLFFTEVIIVLCVFRSLFIIFTHKFRWFGLFVFYCMFYNVTLNNMRQWMAMSILLLGFAYFTKENRRYLFYVILGITFHKTAICGLLVFVVYYFIKKLDFRSLRIKSRRFSGKAIMILCIVFLFFVFIYNMNLTRKIMSIVGLSSFLNYFEGSISFSLGRLVLELPMVLIVLFNWRDMKSNRIRYFLFAFTLINIMFSQINTMNVLAWRISAYISEFIIIICPYTISLCKKRSKRQVEMITMFFYCLIYWGYYFLLCNSHETLPYVIA